MPVAALPEPSVCVHTAMQENFSVIACLAVASAAHLEAQLSLQSVHAAMQHLQCRTLEPLGLVLADLQRMRCHAGPMACLLLQLPQVPHHLCCGARSVGSAAWCLQLLKCTRCHAGPVEPCADTEDGPPQPTGAAVFA